MSSASDDDDENGCVSESAMSISEVSRPSSTHSSRKRKSMSGSVFRAWSIQLTVKSDLGHDTISEEKERLLTEHSDLSTRTGVTGLSLPSSVTCMAVSCDKLLFSSPPDSAVFVSITLQEYAQARYAVPLDSHIPP